MARAEPTQAHLDALRDALCGRGRFAGRQMQRGPLQPVIDHVRVTGRACQALSPRLPDGPTVYRNFPRPGLIWKQNRPTGLLEVEGPDTRQEGKSVRGRGLPLADAFEAD